MSNQPSYESVSAQLEDYLNAKSPAAAESAFKVLFNGAKFVDFTSFLLRHLQSVIRNTNLDECDVS